MSPDLDALLALGVEVLTEAGTRFALIGGCARNTYAPPRATRDVDFAVVADAAAYMRVEHVLRARGFVQVTAVSAQPPDDVPDVALFGHPNGDRIDLLFAKTPFEHAAIARAHARGSLASGAAVPVATLEDLIVYKMIAGRPRDMADVSEMVETQTRAGASIDWVSIGRDCAEWEVTERLEAIRPPKAG